MKKLIKSLILAALAVMPIACFASGEVTGVYNTSSSGTTSATIFVPGGSEPFNITDLNWRLDTGCTTGQVIFRSGESMYQSTSVTSASGTVVWFSNPSSTTAVAVNDFIIIYDESAGTYFLRTVTAATTTSVTVSESLSPGLTASDKIWSVNQSVSRPVVAINSLTTAVNIWMPRSVPTAITLDGNTTACRISASGVRTNYR
jgi:hypothetical protein